MTFDKRKYDQAFIKEKYDRIPINVPKGDKSRIAEHAKRRGFNSLNEFVKHLIYTDMNEKQDSKKINVQNVLQNGDNNNINIG